MIRPMDREQASEIRSSPHWQYIVNELDYRIDIKVAALRACKPEDLAVLQKEISILEEIKRLPDDVADRESNAESETP